MSSVYAVRYLLANASAITAIVPATRIFVGDMPLKTVLPGVLVTQISGSPLNFIRNLGHNQAHTDRVQVSVLARDYASVKQLMPLILTAIRGQRGTINGVTVLDIVPDFQGPDLFDGTLNMFSQSRDLMVRWTETPSVSADARYTEEGALRYEEDGTTIRETETI